ncbi:MAG: hypothetical protein A2493_01920 [Candidatus Magasanikbacteria bacterium RIFOXYC12_FULL_33_11]|uniref:CARDB domain-containing protein n=1 Tax=Candidatus Magasanikbacteria bacterium RIFOXYC12_FULL_33_11 TaxID=1798701 RepID=A0A1F6NLT1_9BACT|nr:MAG: hypothetical protein A2493_01920 [Candidatus Magasanikbacteria bacterium RIFOXYC12_FULL_33_11]
MKFVAEHLKFYHFKKNPHKWFLAFLASPIHFAEMHYKKRYHMQFAHARKLFIFDITLLLSLVVILGAGLFWKFYNPTVTDLVYISIEKTPTRILSGDRLDFSINYKNESEIKLIKPKLKVNLPIGYILEKTEPAEIFDQDSSTFSLPNLEHLDEDSVHIYGRIYATPHVENNISTSLSYKQEGKKKEETKTTPFFAVLRGSTLQTTIELTRKILPNSNIPINITLKNNGDIDLKQINLNLNSLPKGITLIKPETKTGQIVQNIWQIESLKAQESADFQAYLDFNLKNNLDKLQVEFTPEITINSTQIKQETVKHEFTILHPNLTISSNWENDITSLRPGENANLYFNIKNNGNIELKNLEYNFPINTNIIDTTKLKNNNQITLYNNIATMKENKNLKPGESTQIKITIPIKTYPSGDEDLTISPEIQVIAHVDNIENNYQTSAQSPKINIGTNIFTTAEIRYYTKEGDQLGRGPLPPLVGEETKYWALIQIKNGTSRISDLHFSAILPSYVSWTGKSSVSTGNDLSFNSQTKQISWDLKNLSANTTAGIYFELSLTPDVSMINSNPIMLKNLAISAQDTFLDTTINKNIATLDNSLQTDPIGKQKGSSVQE